MLPPSPSLPQSTQQELCLFPLLCHHSPLGCHHPSLWSCANGSSCALYSPLLSAFPSLHASSTDLTSLHTTAPITPQSKICIFHCPTGTVSVSLISSLASLHLVYRIPSTPKCCGLRCYGDPFLFPLGAFTEEVLCPVGVIFPHYSHRADSSSSCSQLGSLLPWAGLPPPPCLKLTSLSLQCSLLVTG